MIWRIKVSQDRSFTMLEASTDKNTLDVTIKGDLTTKNATAALRTLAHLIEHEENKAQTVIM